MVAVPAPVTMDASFNQPGTRAEHARPLALKR